jgi:group I intron endonuclease
MEFWLYKITNLVNNKVYIGQTVSPKQRWPEHKYHARHGKVHPLYNSMRKNGISNFIFETISSYPTQLDIDSAEIQLIAQFKSSDRKFGYNIEPGGDGHCIMAEETKGKISKTRKALYAQGMPHPMKGKKHSTESIAQMSIAKAGKPSTRKGKHTNKPAWNKGLPKEQSPRFGKKHSPETIDRMRQAAIIREQRKRDEDNQRNR